MRGTTTDIEVIITTDQGTDPGVITTATACRTVMTGARTIPIGIDASSRFKPGFAHRSAFAHLPKSICNAALRQRCRSGHLVVAAFPGWREVPVATHVAQVAPMQP